SPQLGHGTPSAPPPRGDAGAPDAGAAGRAGWLDDAGGRRAVGERVSNSVREMMRVRRRTPGSHPDHHANRHTWACRWALSRLVIHNTVLGSELGTVAGSLDDD